MEISVFAGDVGYGGTKYAYRASSGTIVTGMFPSLAPLAAPRKLSAYDEGMLRARNVAIVTIDKIEYEVGPDVSLTATHGRTGRVLTDDYALTNNYAALLFGAIHLAGVAHIERLVLGLPVHTMEKYANTLKQRFAGVQDYGCGRVTIGTPKIIPQPLGSLILASRARGEGFNPIDEHLVIDVGYYTTDWIYAKGFAVDNTRSGGIPGGASQIFQHIASLISRDKGDAVEDIELIDKALRERTTFLFFNEDIDLMPYLKRAEPVIADVVQTIQNNVGKMPSVRSVILSGGGAALYAPVLRRAFPRLKIEMMESPCTANARGYLTVGEAGLARERRLA
ncbi:PRTRC system protein D [Paraburkholderia bannensis]|uniref:PRTRC system protein D n=1 Tax=Paraburkholderia bannensis TaxID=765414 RepID=UPI002AB76050|nr:PRTRC system protein D [Paraburkholderia bannensis]